MNETLLVIYQSSLGNIRAIFDPFSKRKRLIQSDTLLNLVWHLIQINVDVSFRVFFVRELQIETQNTLIYYVPDGLLRPAELLVWLNHITHIHPEYGCLL